MTSRPLRYSGVRGQRPTTMRPPPGRQQLSRGVHRPAPAGADHRRPGRGDGGRGYRAVTVADIVRRAGIARNTFYENFSSKEDCFLAAQDYAVEEALRRVVEAATEVESWPRPGRRRPRRLPRLRRRGAGAGADLHRRGALRRPDSLAALRAVAAGLRARSSASAARSPRTARSCRRRSRRRSSAASSGSSTSGSSRARRRRSRSCGGSWSSSSSPPTSAPKPRNGRLRSRLEALLTSTCG